MFFTVNYLVYENIFERREDFPSHPRIIFENMMGASLNLVCNSKQNSSDLAPFNQPKCL